MKWSLLLFVLTIVVQVSCTKACFQEEKTALLDFKAFLEFNNASVKPLLPSWISDPKSDCCGWEGVTCDPYSNHVMQLSLEKVNGPYQSNVLKGFFLSKIHKLKLLVLPTL